MNPFLCYVIKVLGLLRYTWRSFKMLQTLQLEAQYAIEPILPVTDAEKEESANATLDLDEAFYSHFMALHQRRQAREKDETSQRGTNRNSVRSVGTNRNSIRSVGTEQFTTVLPVASEQEKQQIIKLKYRMWKQSELQLLAQYFLVITLFSGFELAEVVLQWVPFYYTAKFALLGYLFFPHLKGGEIIYFDFILPNMENDLIEQEIDASLLLLYNASNVAIELVSKPLSTLRLALSVTYEKLKQLCQYILRSLRMLYQYLVLRPVQVVMAVGTRLAQLPGEFAAEVSFRVNRAFDRTARRLYAVYASFLSLLFFWRKKPEPPIDSYEDGEATEPKKTRQEERAGNQDRPPSSRSNTSGAPKMRTGRVRVSTQRDKKPVRFRQSKKLLLKMAGIEAAGPKPPTKQF